MATPGETAPAAQGAVEGPSGDWVLPEWEAYSEASVSSFRGDWSDVEADVSLDTASSSVASTEHQRVYRLQRQRQRAPRQRDLKEMHSLYSQRRRDVAAPSTASSADTSRSAAWFQPTACWSPSRTGSRPLSPIAAPPERREHAAAAQKELLAQQGEISAELHAVRQQLSDFQAKWKQSVARPSTGLEATASSEAPTATSSPSSRANDACASPCSTSRAVQTDADGQDDAVTHWTRLLSLKVDALVSRYSHAPSQAFHAATTHLSGLQDSRKHSDEPGEGPASSWHVGRELKTLVSVHVATHLLELERSLASLHAAIETHERRQLALFDRAVRQVQGHHHDKLQRVVDEALSELKLVRGRNKKKEAQWERELRVANQHADAWKQRVAELEHADQLRQEAVAFRLQALRADSQREAQRHAEDLERLREELRVARSERLTGVTHDGEHEDAHTKELHERELRALQATIHELRDDARAKETQVDSERRSFAKALEDLRTTQQQLQSGVVASMERRHTEEVVAVRAEYEQRLAQLAAKMEAKDASRPSEKATGTSEDASCDPQASNDPSQPSSQMEELHRRCRALESLLADAQAGGKACAHALSSPVEREAGHSVRDLGSSRSSSGSGSASSESSSTRRGPTGTRKALARALLGVAANDSALATDEATLGAPDWGDSASWTSMDTVDELASLASRRTTPRHGAPELRALARKLQQAARGEPDPEIRAEPLRKQQSRGEAEADHPGGSAPVRPRASVFDDLLAEGTR